MCIKLDCESTNSNLTSSCAATRTMPPSVTLGCEPQKASAPPEDVASPSAQRWGVKPTNAEGQNIENISEESEAMQKAIALSLRDQQEPVSNYYSEDRDATDVGNPHERKRIVSIPLGLKNIGNSCWFNVVIQPLFHIQAFRNLILSSPSAIKANAATNSKCPEEKLVPTLRYLYSLLLESDKRFIDPTDCVSVFQGPEMVKNTQQDVCEFVHKLLQKLEEEFKLVIQQKGIEKESAEWKITKESDFENPIMQLFYGQSRKEQAEMHADTKLETFGQYPLTVQNYKDIHESILASMTKPTIEAEMDQPTTIQQETWFKILPPVLIFSLSRYEYSKEKKRAEKVHNKFEFPDCLFMDRYMEVNKHKVEQKHLTVAKLKLELLQMTNTLETYEKFGSGVGKFPIVDILQYTLEFAQKHKSNIGPDQVMDVDESSGTDVEMLDCVSSSDMSISSTHISGLAQPFETSSPHKKRKISSPSPQEISQSELHHLSHCLPRWQNEMQQKVDQLKRSIADLETDIQCIYDEAALQKIPYKLHAVIVHEGQACGGHYWVYVFDDCLKGWLKFNDMQVTASSWEELLQDSIGGQNNASAYCLMYIDQTRYERLFPKRQHQSCASDLAIDLQDYVKSHNLSFSKQLTDWDVEVAKETSVRLVPKTAPNSPDISCVDQRHTTFWLDIQTMLNNLLEQSLTNLAAAEFPNTTEWVESTLLQSIQRLRELSDHQLNNKVEIEPSLVDFGIYLTMNDVDPTLVNWYALEVLWQQAQKFRTPAINAILSETLSQLQRMRDTHMRSLGAVFAGWKTHYENYVRCAWLFIVGHKKYEDGFLEEACSFFIHCLNSHHQIRESSPMGPRKTLNTHMLYTCHRACLKRLNEVLVQCVRSSKSGNELIGVDETVSNLIIPAIYFLLKSQSTVDEDTSEFVRNQWCELLNTSATGGLETLLPDIISKIFNISTDKVALPMINIPPYPNVLSLSKEYQDLRSIVVNRSDALETQTSNL